MPQSTLMYYKSLSHKSHVRQFSRNRVGPFYLLAVMGSMWLLQGLCSTLFARIALCRSYGTALREGVTVALKNICKNRPYALTSHLHNNDAMLGVKTCRAARTCCAGRMLALSRCAGPGRPGGMACRGWPAGCMLDDGARNSASFDPQHAGAPFCDVICMRSIGITTFISSIESQKSAITIQRCSNENQKGAITIDFCTAIAPFCYSTEHL